MHADLISYKATNQPRHRGLRRLWQPADNKGTGHCTENLRSHKSRDTNPPSYPRIWGVACPAVPRPHSGSSVLPFRCTGDVLVRLPSDPLSFHLATVGSWEIHPHHFGSASRSSFLSVRFFRLATLAQWMGPAVP